MERLCPNTRTRTYKNNVLFFSNIEPEKIKYSNYIQKKKESDLFESTHRTLVLPEGL